MSRTPSNPWHADDTEIVTTLGDASFETMQVVRDSSNLVLLVELSHPERGRGLGIYKPARGERPLIDFPYGSLLHREVAAYECARLLGWDLVPPTVECVGPHGEGSLQLFIEHDPEEHYFVLREDRALWLQLVRLAVFDLVANNADRKGGHVLRDTSGRLWAIDNGLTFHPEEKLRTVIWDFAGVEVPANLRDDLRRLAAAVRIGDPTTERLLAHLRRREPIALVDRIDRLLEAGTLPEMYPWRCTPWPLI